MKELFTLHFLSLTCACIFKMLTTVQSPSGVWEVMQEIDGVCELRPLRDSPQAVPLDILYVPDYLC